MTEQEEKPKMATLNEDQVNYALDLIKELHPLNNEPFHKAYPVTKYLCCCCVCLPTLTGAESTDGLPSEQEPLLADQEAQKGDTIIIGGKEVKKRKAKKRKNPSCAAQD
jgi:hypothetical protein